MWQKILAFFTAIIAFLASIFGFSYSDGNGMMNLSYGTHERQKMDLFLPEDSDGEVGLILMIHGGAWIAGDKESYTEAAEYACDSYGYAAAAINYRYLGEGVTLHDIADDIDAALALIKKTAEEKGIKIEKVLLTGSSAGAHLAMFYAYSRYETAPITPAAVVSNCGPTDFTDENFYINNELGDKETIADLFSLCIGKDFSYDQRADYAEELKAVSPLYYVNESTVPTIINHGQVDTIVPYSNALSIVEKFEEYSVNYDFFTFPNSGHGLDADPDVNKASEKVMFEYIFEYLGVETA